jgi:hypothetical protein
VCALPAPSETGRPRQALVFCPPPRRRPTVSMSRRHVLDGYDDSRDSDRRGSRDPRNARDSRDIQDQRETRSSRDQPIIRGLRERRHPGERGVYVNSREPGEEAEIRVARGAREPRENRGPRQRRESRDDRDEMDTEDIRIRDRRYLQDVRGPRRIAPLENTRDARHDQEDVRETRYFQDSRQDRNEMDDPMIPSPSRENWDERQVQYERSHRRDHQPSNRNDVVGEDPQHFVEPRNYTLSSVDERAREYFLPEEDISLEVLGRYLGPEAIYRPSMNREARTCRCTRL